MAKKPSDPNRPKRQPKPGQTKGYCCPPKSGQIKPGEVRNPHGPKGKPKPVDLDAFEFAAAQMTKITINGEEVEKSAEHGAWLRTMAEALKGDLRAQGQVALERRSRRALLPPIDIEKELEDAKTLEERKRLSAKLIVLLEREMTWSKLGLLGKGANDVDLAPWFIEAIGDYREKHGAPRDPGHGDWNPHPPGHELGQTDYDEGAPWYSDEST